MIDIQVNTLTPREDARGALRLLVIDDEKVDRLSLPASGTIVVGRSVTADLQIENPAISRHHFALSIGEPLKVRDLGSRNGIEVGGRRVPAETAVQLAVGEPISIGRITVIVQRMGRSDGCGTIVVDTSAHEVRCNSTTISFARRPVLRRLLYTLAAAASHSCAKATLVREVWRVAYHPLRHDNILRVTVHHLRGLLQAIGMRVDLIEHTGYRLVMPSSWKLHLQ